MADVLRQQPSEFRLSEGTTIGGDNIQVGDIKGSYAAIGAGASVVVNQVQQALSAVDELEKSIQVAERRLAEAIQKKARDYARLVSSEHVQERQNPYKALLDYKIEDAPFFDGRLEAIQAMRERLAQNRLTVLHSESGSGKTSLLQAGLASRLVADGHLALYLRPYKEAPGRFIRKAFLPDYQTQEELSRFRDERMSLRGFLERVTAYLGERRLYLLIDQFEEFFTELPVEAQTAFAQELQDCVASDLNVWWVLALRKEYFSDLRIFATVRPFDNEYFLPTFQMEEARHVIVGPAAQKGVVYEAQLVERILTDLWQDGQGISPAQVQLVCYTLFEERSPDSKLLTCELYDRPRGRGVSGAEGILTSHLSRVLQRELSGEERRLAHQALEALVTSEKRRAVKSRGALLQELDTSAQQLEPILTVLINNRLLRADEDDNDEPVYELAHDYLLTEIDLDPETQGRKAAQEMLATAVAQYRLRGRLLSQDDFEFINSRRPNLKLDHSAVELLEKSEPYIAAERQREVERLQRELTTQRQLIWRTRGFLTVVTIIAILLAINPVQRIYWRWKALQQSELITIPEQNLPVGECAAGAADQEVFISFVTCASPEPVQQIITVESFGIEKYEVSNNQYRLCVRAGGCTVPNAEPFNDEAFGDYPVQGVTALQASSYCQWIGRTLPTELQWEAALGQNSEYSVESHDLLEVNQAAHISAFGVVNLLGNVSEWTRSYHVEDLQNYEERSWDGESTGLSFSDFLIIRGNSWNNSSTRMSMDGRVNAEIFGIRCATATN